MTRLPFAGTRQARGPSARQRKRAARPSSHESTPPSHVSTPRRPAIDALDEVRPASCASARQTATAASWSSAAFEPSVEPPERPGLGPPRVRADGGLHQAPRGLCRPSGRGLFGVHPRRAREEGSQIRFLAARNRLRLTDSWGKATDNAHGGAITESRRPAAAGHRAAGHPSGHRPLHRGRGPRAEAPRRLAQLHRRRSCPRGPHPRAGRRPPAGTEPERRDPSPAGSSCAGAAACSTTRSAPCWSAD